MAHRRTYKEYIEFLYSLVGKEFGFLTITATIIDELPKKLKCRCRCGTIKKYRPHEVLAGRRISCGCKRVTKPETWTCRTCKKSLPFTGKFFSTNRSNIHELKWECRECERIYARGYVRKTRRSVIEHYSAGKFCCDCCGETEFAFLTLDHINNDGKFDRLLHGWGHKAFLRLIRENFPPNFQVLCLNCNLGRAFNGGVCPHKQKKKVIRVNNSSSCRPCACP